MKQQVVLKAQQIRAARALLDWSQDDLAKASGLSIATIRKLESGSISPRGKTTTALLSAFEEETIEFLPPMGVRVKDSNVTVLDGYNGEEVYLRLMDDAYHTLKDKKGELIIWNADNAVSPESVIISELRMRTGGIKFRYLVEDGDTYLYFPLEEYRWIGKKYFRNTVQVIYGNKVALSVYPNMTTQQIKRIIIIESAPLAESMRNAFNFIWEHSQKPTHSTAPKTYE